MKPHHTIIDTIPLPDGIAGITDGTTIWLNPRLTEAGRRCTLAHELIHVDRGLPPPGLEAKEETKVDKATARQLTPVEQLLDAVIWTHGGHNHTTLAWELNLDLPTLRTRLDVVTPDELHLINHALAELEQVP
ncbi:hypothetical protein B842_03525 [Corynebacterium humireducens NBRC 106098 = DSM 45392]|uniref:IrrE N-terminal-like domain-containing protein n=1 Tax=Corynebacterium humireducens NBRC 106098 = DSM 45392 TaxID=1223515 RepID=A0A0B5D8J8_9CORY|nr:hypothetical protein [Corynebacterium humireducens]AJE32558.1 hypothetical protein B842_03525 [Corynebacterium humireducens NBRC 106098 = DSM 45392]